MGRHASAPFSSAREESLEIREEDKLLITRSNRERGLAALDQAQVKGFDETTVTLKFKGVEHVFERSDPALQSLTHGYAITSHAAQGKTASDVVAVIDSRERMLTSQVGFYVSVSRSAERLATVVDDKSKVLSVLQRHTGLKSSALDAVQRMESITNLGEPPLAGHDASDSTSREGIGAEREPASTSSGRDSSCDEQSQGAEKDMEIEPTDMDISL